MIKWLIPLFALTAPLVAAEPPDFEEEAPVPAYDYGKEFLKMILALVAIIALIFIVAFLTRRFNQGRLAAINGGSEMQIIERRSLGPKAALYLVEVDRHRLIVGLSPQGIHQIATFPLDREALTK